MSPIRINKYDTKPLADFINLVENNQTYTGLVESLGYVYWEEKTLWFEHVNSADRFASPIYEKRPGQLFVKNRLNPVKSQIVYMLKIMSPEELKRLDLDMYYDFYGDIFEMPGFPVDALRVHRDPLPFSSSLSKTVEGDGSSSILRFADIVDDAVGAPMGVAELVTGCKTLGKLGSLLSTMMILYDVDRGEYWSAGGETLLFAITQLSSKANTCVGILSLGNWIYEMESTQMKLAKGYAKKYKELGETRRSFLKLYYLAESDKNVMLMKKWENEMRKINEEMNKEFNSFKKCMDKLGYTY